MVCIKRLRARYNLAKNAGYTLLKTAVRSHYNLLVKMSGCRIKTWVSTCIIEGKDGTAQGMGCERVTQPEPPENTALGKKPHANVC